MLRHRSCPVRPGTSPRTISELAARASASGVVSHGVRPAALTRGPAAVSNGDQPMAGDAVADASRPR